MSERWDAWKDSYDDWKLATPPEYEEEESEESLREEAAWRDGWDDLPPPSRWHLLKCWLRWKAYSLSPSSIRHSYLWWKLLRAHKRHNHDFTDEVPF